ncbi:MAG: fibronectin type III domain-containing protein [Geobacteraceae bacterium]|nr:fibronectin type III domain-containing protein [Geobacteraceae bacterium]NTW81185.1 fibronectin type III domain-containing protein [Geobacteraceae bacterium]
MKPSSYSKRIITVLSTLIVLFLVSCLLHGCSGSSGSSDSASVNLTALPVPDNPSAKVSDSTAVIAWNTVGDAEDYTLYVSTAPNVDPATAIKVEHVAPPYTMGALVNGTTYYFRVQAICTNTCRVSETSAELSVTPRTAPPGAPTEIAAIAGDSFVVLQWSPVAGATSYNIYWGVSSGISKMAGEHFYGATSPYIHYIPISDTGSKSGSGGSGGHKTETTVTKTALAAVQKPTSSSTEAEGGQKGPPAGKGPKVTGTMFFYAVTAVDIYGQESKVSAEVGAAPKKPGGMPGGEEEGFGSNLAVPLIFAEGYGLGGLPVTDETGNKLYANTGLRNSDTPPNPFWSAVFSDIYIKDSVSYYMQKTASSWQAEWRNGAGTPQPVIIDWSDNITGHGWNTTSMIHVENVLYQAPVDEAGNPVDLMNSFVMTHLFGARYSEKFGTTGASLLTNYRTIFTPNARLIIEKIAGQGLGRDPLYNGGKPVLDKAVYEGFGNDGPGWYRTEVNGSGKLVYGYNFMMKKLAGTDAEKAGWWRLTFQIDPVATYTVTGADGATSTSYTVNSNTILTTLDPSDDKAEAKFRPVLQAPNQSVLEIQVAAGKGGSSSHGGGETEDTTAACH